LAAGTHSKIFIKPAFGAKGFSGTVLNGPVDASLSGEYGLLNGEIWPMIGGKECKVLCNEVVNMNSEYAVYVVDGQIRNISHYMCKKSSCRCSSGELAAVGGQVLTLDMSVVEDVVRILATNEETKGLSAGYRADFALVKSNGSSSKDDVWKTGLVEVNDGYVAGRYDDMPISDYCDMMISRFASLQATAVKTVPFIEQSTVSLFSAAGINDVSEIMSRVSTAKEALMSIYPYKCVQECKFCVPRCLAHPCYSMIVKKSKQKLNERKILDLGCCMGTDLRQFVKDGLCVDIQHAFGFDSELAFMETGMKMFGDAKKWQSQFISGNALTLMGSGEEKKKDDGGNNSLFMHAPFTYIYTGAFFHLLSESDQERLAAVAFELLGSGGTLFGRHVASGEEMPFEVKPENKMVSQLKWMHTPKTFTSMLESIGFVNVVVNVHASDMTAKTMNYGGRAKCYLAFVCEKN
jgi:hypothetical protein